MNIRPMREEDVARVMEIASGLPEAPQWHQSVYAIALDPKAVPARVALVAEDRNDSIQGFLIAVLIPPQAELETIVVAQDAQRQGIGARIFASLLDFLKNRQVTEVMLEVRESNGPARGFYASMGFSQTGSRVGYYSDPKEDAILLSRSVPGA